MVFSQEFGDMPHISNCNFSTTLNSQQTSDSDQLLQEIIDDTVMKMIPDDIDFCQDEVIHTCLLFILLQFDWTTRQNNVKLLNIKIKNLQTLIDEFQWTTEDCRLCIKLPVCLDIAIKSH